MAERSSDLPEFEAAPSVRIDQAMPEKGSIVVLSDAAFRLMIESICYCGRNETNGFLPATWLRKNGRPKAIAELVAQGHLAEVDNATYQLPDYLRWNRAASEINAYRQSKSEGGSKGAHMRWHEAARKKVKDCAYCYPDTQAASNG
ncbi:hypothetical protein ATK74_0826 [Propionicimonas paludicola]|uniref:Uncharacterized protein n=1 Tax=Propionicimonas paludicola TaxID=185243 RepID=A0A2A9CRQ5_9ACTN|nr:hypothetical protein [Propionicimonas paludicola]PFG16292.1 hypothetical protein ATK74_0826 [Propionicimonas paludicola]